MYTVRSVGGAWEVFDGTGRKRSDAAQTKQIAVDWARGLAGPGAHILVYGEAGNVESAFFCRSEAAGLANEHP